MKKDAYISMLVALNDHPVQIQRALDEVKDEYDILLQSCLSAKGRIIQPQALSPSHMIETLRSSQDSFHVIYKFQFHQMKLTYSLINILGTETYIMGNNLMHIVKVPLVTHFVYDIYKVLPFPIKINETRYKYTCIRPEEEYLLIENTKQCYVKLRQKDE
jgi:hypothetical protein